MSSSSLPRQLADGLTAAPTLMLYPNEAAAAVGLSGSSVWSEFDLKYNQWIKP